MNSAFYKLLGHGILWQQNKSNAPDMYVCMYICMYVYTHTHTHTDTHTHTVILNEKCPHRSCTWRVVLWLVMLFGELMGQCSLARGSTSLLVSFECYSLTLLLVPSASCLQLVIGFFSFLFLLSCLLATVAFLLPWTFILLKPKWSLPFINCLVMVFYDNKRKVMPLIYMYVCMYVCMYVYTHTHTHTLNL